MKRLYNRVNRVELKKKLEESIEPRTTLSFYRYHQLSDPTAFRDELYAGLDRLGVFGRIYIASEGINGQISVLTDTFDDFKNYLYSIPWLNGCRLNIAVDDNGKSFFKLNIKLRNKIVADGLDDSTFDVTKRGKHLSAPEVNALLDKPDTIVVDMRNHYESEVGHYENAICPDVETFREALPIVEDLLTDKKKENIVMYCTGGIRCEKASAYYLHKGFEQVYMIDGGIIEYTRQCEELNLPNKFIGKNFVFDERLGERISNDIIAQCHQCGKSADTHTNCLNDACHLLFIQCDECKEAMKGCCSEECMHVNELPEETKIELRKGIDKGNMIFNKSRQRLRPRLDEINGIHKEVQQ